MQGCHEQAASNGLPTPCTLPFGGLGLTTQNMGLPAIHGSTIG